jgi:hypothetical protein
MKSDLWPPMLMFAIALVAALSSTPLVGVVIVIYAAALRISNAIETTNRKDDTNV